MASGSLQRWLGPRAAALEQLEAAHRSLGGTGPGRRYAVEQINHGYAVLLSAQFQGFCRDLHSESADFVIRNANPVTLRVILTLALKEGRKIDRGNPNPGNIGSDFGRFGLEFWRATRSAEPRSAAWQAQVERLNEWRNAIAHQDFAAPSLGVSALRLQQVRSWRRACNGLARTFDEVMRLHLFTLIGSNPW